jgi:ubiquinone biosynthesis protein
MQTTAIPRVGWFDAARRLQRVGLILARHGFGEVVARIGLSVPQLPFRGPGPSSDERFAKRLADTCSELGPTYLKLGQLLATRADLFAPELIKALSTLHSSVRPTSFARVAKAIERELGQPYSTAFRSFDRECLAAASIAQVHRATLHDGSEVAVKVQRPGLQALVEADLTIMRRLAELMAQHIDELASYDPVGLVEAFARSIHQELDFRTEAVNAARLREALRGSRDVLVPHVHGQFTSQHVLVMEYAPGTRVNAITPEECLRVRSILLRAFVRQTLDHGVFHADPHPGNMLVHRDGRVVLLDFGAIDMLAPPLRRELSRFTLALATHRTRALCESVIAIAGSPSSQKIDRTRMQIDVQRLLGATSRGDGAGVIDQMFSMSRAHGLRLPPSMLALMRAIAILDGVLRSLDPSSDILSDLRREFLWALLRRLGRALSFPVRWTQAHLRRLRR